MRLFFLLWFCIYASWLTAEAQTAETDTAQEAEALIIQQSRQREIDSLVRVELQRQLADFKSDTARHRQLQEQIQQNELAQPERDAEQQRRIAELKKNTPGFPVVLHSDTLFKIYMKTGSFKAQERAAAVSRRVEKLYTDDFFTADSLKIVPNESSVDVAYGDLVIISATELDALWSGVSQVELAQDYRAKILAAVTAEKKANSLLNWAIRLGLVLLIILGGIVLVYGINRLFRLTRRYLLVNRSRYLNGINVRKIQVIDRNRNVQLALTLNNILRIIVILLSFYLALPLLFSIFPDTRTWADKLLQWILTPAIFVLSGIFHYLPNLFTILVVYFFTHYAVKGVKFLANEVEAGNVEFTGFHRDWAQPTFKIVRFILYAFMFVIIFPYLPGSSSPAFQGVSVFLGLLLSLGSSSAISNVVAGLVITYMRPFKIGDRVKIGDVSGDVMEKTLLVTRIRTTKNEDITVPNSAILSGHTINYTSSSVELGLIMHTTITIGYDVPWRQVHELLISAALATPGIDAARPPFVLQTSLDDFYVSYQINAYISESNRMPALYSGLLANIQDKFNEAGVEIMSPHYKTLRDGNTVAIPPEYLPKDYTPPPFNFQQKKSGDGGF